MMNGRAIATRAVLAVLVITLASGCHTLGFGRRQSVNSAPSIWPVANSQRQVTSGFGHRKDPRTGEERFHSGVDIVAPRRSRIVAAAAGIVTYADRDGDYGKIVRLDHGNGYETWYAHLASIKTRKGRKVERGRVIGKLGATGRATAPHLHYEVRREGRPIDPRPYLPE